MVIPSKFKNAREAAQRVLAQVHACGYSKESHFAIKLAMEEAMINAIKHGNGSDPEKKLTVEFAVDRRRAVIVVTDEGAGFDPGCVPDPTADENLECPTGRGIMLMRAYMDEVVFNASGNSVRMVKHNA